MSSSTTYKTARDECQARAMDRLERGEISAYEAEHPETVPSLWAPVAATSTMETVRTLTAVASGDWSDLEPGAAESEELDPDGDMQDDAQNRLYEWPLCVEASTTFEIVLGTGGPDTRLMIECDRVEFAYEVRNVFYRYSWSGYSDIRLTGEDREAAEAFARMVVPELAE